MISSKHLVCGIGAFIAGIATAGDLYIVKDGDTLSGIALKHKISGPIFGPNGGVEKLRRLNDLANPDRIYPGDLLKIGPGPAPETATSKESENKVVLDNPSVANLAEPEDSSPMVDAPKPTIEEAESNLVTPAHSPLAIDYLVGIGVSQSTLAGKFVDQSVGNARWHSRIASNIWLELLHRFAENWAVAGEASWQRIEYNSPSDRLRGKKLTNTDFGTKIIRDFDMFAFGLGIKRSAINPVVPLLNERYQLTSFHGNFITLDWEKEFNVFDAITLSPHVGFAWLVSGNGYGVEVDSGTLITAGMTARWSLNHIEMFIDPILERRLIKSEVGTSLVNSRSLILGVNSLPLF